MKNLSKIILLFGVIGLVCLSCKKDSDNSNSSGLSGNKLSGKISNWSYGSDKKLIAYGINDDILGETTIAADGSFTVTLTSPAASALESFADSFDESLAISDPAAKCASLELDLADAAGDYFGYIENSSYTTTGYANGFAAIEYLYSTKKTTVKGIFNQSYSFESIKATYDVTFNEGWNNMGMLVTKYIQTDTSYIVEYAVNNSSPSTVKWTYFPDKKK
jgi:hypothetical protein